LDVREIGPRGRQLFLDPSQLVRILPECCQHFALRAIAAMFFRMRYYRMTFVWLRTNTVCFCPTKTNYCERNRER
jgi:hypothetical protein